MIVLITGGTRGLGRLTVKKLIDNGHTVIITGRSQPSLDAARKWITQQDQSKDKNLHTLIVDLSDLKSIKCAVEDLASFDCIDIVVHNAGGISAEFELVGQVESTVFKNAVGPLYLNRLLLPFVEKSKSAERRILFVTSSLHDPQTAGGGRSENARLQHDVKIQDLTGSEECWDSMKYYRMSKLATCWNAYVLANQGSKVPVISFCPGFVPSTDLNRQSGLLIRLLMRYVLTWFSFTVTEEHATDDYMFYITQPGLENGSHYRKRMACSSSKDSLDVSKQQEYLNFANEQIRQLL